MSRLVPVLVLVLLARGPAPKLPPFWETLDLTDEQKAEAAAIWRGYLADLAKLRADLRKSQAQHDSMAPYVAAVHAKGPEAERRYQKGLDRYEAIGARLEEEKASLEKLDRDTTRRLEALLTKSQRRRLLGIWLGKVAPDVKLDEQALSDKQVERLRDLLRGYLKTSAGFDEAQARIDAEAREVLRRQQTSRPKPSLPGSGAPSGVGDNRMDVLRQEHDRLQKEKERARQDFLENVKKIAGSPTSPD
jgi:hypothetical protein